jgi:hypothetical protein
MSEREGALFEALNAKKLSPTEVAATFVVPPQYEQLVGPDHAFLVGPRGSGKTTLLRMLQGESLMAWNHPRADIYRRRVRYSSVFLPADRLWASQVSPSNSASPLGVAAFTAQLLYALVETMLYRLPNYTQANAILHPAELSHRAEVDLVAECAEAWHLPVRSPSLLGLQGALDLRLSAIASQIELGATGNPDLGSWTKIAPVEALRFGIRAFNRHSRQVGHRWALLLDEMELAPEPVHHALRNALRGGEQSLVLKLSFSPFDRYAPATADVGDATPENDFRPIYLWYGTRVGSRKFTRGLWNRMMTEATGSSKAATAVLGPSTIDVSGSSSAKSYRVGGKHMELVQAMQRQDAAFARHLEAKGIDTTSPEALSYSQRSSTLRKIYPLLVFRDAVLEFEEGIPRRRQRKKYTECFTGADAVFAALEGNPRWVKAVFSTLLARYDGTSPIGRGAQYDTLKEAAERFESLLRLLPVEGDGRDAPVLSLLDDIARYFSHRAFGEFTPDPPAAFRVDDKVPQSVIDALTTALSAGAVVHLRGKRSPVVLPDLYGERFRLAYLLTIRDGLEVPLRLGKTTNLSSILAWAERGRAAPTEAGHGETQAPTLWEWGVDPS